VRFVAKRHTAKVSEETNRTCQLGIRWYNFQSCIYRPWEPQCTDRRTDDMLMPIADHTV